MTTSIRTDARLKQEADQLFTELDITELCMNFLTAANMFLRQVVRMQGLLLRPTRDVPNAVTAAAMRAANRIATDPKAPGFATVDELFANQDARPCAR